MKKKEKFPVTKAVLRTILAANVMGVLFNLGATVYSLIPRYDTVKGIDTDSLIENLTPKEVSAQEIIEERKAVAAAMNAEKQ